MVNNRVGGNKILLRINALGRERVSNGIVHCSLSIIDDRSSQQLQMKIKAPSRHFLLLNLTSLFFYVCEAIARLSWVVDRR